MSSELTSKIKYSNRCMAHSATRHTMFWSGVLQEVIKFLEDEDVPACLPCTSAGLNVRLAVYHAGVHTTSWRRSHAASLYQVLFQRTRDNRGEEKGEGRWTHWERRVRVLLAGMNSSSSSEVSFLSPDVCVCECRCACVHTVCKKTTTTKKKPGRRVVFCFEENNSLSQALKA